jgi:hypothetical protein
MFFTTITIILLIIILIIAFILKQPFSISSSPFDRCIRFHIRALGDWTNNLKKLLEDHSSNPSVSSAYTSDLNSVMGVKGSEPLLVLPIHIEGPYGISSIDLFGSQYEVISRSIQLYNLLIE